MANKSILLKAGGTASSMKKPGTSLNKTVNFADKDKPAKSEPELSEIQKIANELANEYRQSRV